MLSRKIFSILVAITLLMSWAILSLNKDSSLAGAGPQVYWFVPDGLRAEPVTFKIFEWARNGELPNLKKMIDAGAFGYSRPVFPSHTPTNFATLMTGSYPAVHGVADGAMRMPGYPLAMVARGGFSSLAKKVPPIWRTLEQNQLKSGLLSVPGSTPPDIFNGTVIKGRWGGWGVDFPSIIFQSESQTDLNKLLGNNRRVFTFGSELTRFLKATTQEFNFNFLRSEAPIQVLDLDNWNLAIKGYLIDPVFDGVKEYSEAAFFIGDREIARLRVGEWSPWLPVQLQWNLKDDYNVNTPKKTALERDLSVVTAKTHLKIKLIRLSKEGEFRIRFVYDCLNKFITEPPEVSDELEAWAGPMIDFVDNYPPQLVYFAEDKDTFLEEASMSWQWHQRAVSYMIENRKHNLVIHSVYNPNQMLTSRWWLPYLDPVSPKYHEISEEQRARLWSEVKSMYVEVDKLLGEVLTHMPKDSYIVFSSDHGALPLYKEIRLNSLFAQKGWLKFRYDSKTGEHEIDWEHTQVIYLQMNNVYINPQGLGGTYQIPSGPEYDRLCEEVKRALESLKGPQGEKVISKVLRRSEAGSLMMPAERVGDLIVANEPPFGFTEDLDESQVIFADSFKGGYKQAILPTEQVGLLTPFVVYGPGIKAGYEIKNIINHVDQYPTIMKILGQKVPDFVQGHAVEEIFK